MSESKPSEIKKPLADNAQWMKDPLWFKDAVIYELHIKAFFDSDNNGTGDFTGLIQKLDYLQDLGVNTLWLLPFYPSPMRDDGYDIADYRNVHPEYGTMANFKQFVREAHRRGLKVITEMVINHTSDQHPWFQAARRAPEGSSKRNYYVWSDTDRKFPETRIIFQDAEKSNWAWDEEAKAYYWHRFFSHQPDLNFNNPQVVKAVIRLMRFWLDLGVDGLRLDAIPYLCVREGTQNENLPETHTVIKQMRAVLDEHYLNRVFLAEVNQWPEDVRDYFSDGDECQMAYHFPLMPRMYMAIAQEDRHPIVDIMRQTPDIPETCQWAVFLRNHDELTLEMVTDKERDYMYQMYVGDPRARVNVGIRRRLAPLMDNEIDKIKLMNNLLLSMPGSPIIYYGDEIGMGDNFFLGDRNGVRTPMQWSPDRNAGFSRADPQRLYLPPIMDPVYGYESVNVEAQLRERASLLNWMQRVLALRKNHQAFGRGKLVFLHPGNRKILAYFRLYEDDIILCVSNLSRAAQAVELDLSAYKGCVPVELMGRSAFPPIGELPYLLTLPGHNYYWFRLASGEEVPAWHEEHLLPEELPTLVLFDGWHSFFRDRVVPWRIAMAEKARTQLEQDALPRFVAAQRWYGAKGEVIRRVLIVDCAEWVNTDNKWLVALFNIEVPNGGDSLTYFLPLSLAWENGDEERLHAMSPTTVAKVRQQAQVGIMGDAFADGAFCRAVVQAIGARQTLACGQGSIRFLPTDAFAALAGAEFANLSVRPPGTQGSNTAVVLGDQLFLKGYRHLQIGTHPEFEVGRFLTEVAHFPNTAPLIGVVEYQGTDGNNMTLALLQGYIENQGDGWNLPPRDEDSPERPVERRRDKEVYKRHLAGLVEQSSDVAGFLEENLHIFNGKAGESSSFDLLHNLIKAQAYRLAFWRVASDEINYRRFFDINDLAGLRMENDEVFDATHQLVLQLIREGKLDGLRLDHPDGLYDPEAYFCKLVEQCSRTGHAPYLVVEKILAVREDLRSSWPVQGTTGYEFTNLLNGLFVATSAAERMTRLYNSFIGEHVNFDDLLYRSKKLIMKTALSGELNVLANLLSKIAEADRHTCNYTLNGLRTALAEIVACFPVYRGYISSAREVVPEDRRNVEQATAAAKRRSTTADTSIFDFLRDVLTLAAADGKSPAYYAQVLAFAMKFQQFTSPVMAKGLEDTGAYIYHRLLSLNEVGGDLRQFGVTRTAFHRANLARAEHWPHAMLTTSTHDTKRSEDVRARLNVLSEIPAAWRLALRHWSRANRSLKRMVDGMPVPTANDEYFIYQTLLGIWPPGEPDANEMARFSVRLAEYLVKAVREAKVYTSWINPNTVYEDAILAFADKLINAPAESAFLTDFLPFQRRIARLGLFNSLSQTLIKLTVPGVPDIYQGCECWNFSLVDPDNRRPVDFGYRRTLLDTLQTLATLESQQRSAGVRALCDKLEDGRAKLLVVRTALALRQRWPDVFQQGKYLPLAVKGEHAAHLCAYARIAGGRTVITVAPRFFAQLLGEADTLPLGENVWGITTVDMPFHRRDNQYKCAFTGKLLKPHQRLSGWCLPIAQVLAEFPVGLIVVERGL